MQADAWQGNLRVAFLLQLTNTSVTYPENTWHGIEEAG